MKASKLNMSLAPFLTVWIFGFIAGLCFASMYIKKVKNPVDEEIKTNYSKDII